MWAASNQKAVHTIRRFSNSHLNHLRGKNIEIQCFTCIRSTDPIFCSYGEPQETQKHIIVHYNLDLQLFLFFSPQKGNVVHPCMIHFKSFLEKSVCFRIK